MMPVLRPIEHYNHPGEITAYDVQCPGCGWAHRFMVKKLGNHAVWTFNGDHEKPTFMPSLLVNRKDCEEYRSGVPTCHSWVEDGKWDFLNDCTHHLAGKKVDS